MSIVTSFAIDYFCFVGISWLLWTVAKRSIPIAVIPIVLAICINASGYDPAALGLPSAIGDTIGFVAVNFLAFTAGLEIRAQPEGSGRVTVMSEMRLYLSAAVAIILPFVVGGLLAYFTLERFPGWSAGHGNPVFESLGIGLCIAISALPVLLTIVREFHPHERTFGHIAIKMAVIDDMVLWVALANLLVFFNSTQHQAPIFYRAASAVILLCLPIFGLKILNKYSAPSRTIAVLAIVAFIVAGSWSSSQFGLHALVGSYFAGAVFPYRWLKEHVIDRLSNIVLLTAIPLFLGHGALRINPETLNFGVLAISLLLLLVSASSKITAVVLLPPLANMNIRTRTSIGSLLQCKGLMEIIAASILVDAGVISDAAFAALILLAVFSTLLTVPLFRLLHRPGLPSMSASGSFRTEFQNADGMKKGGEPSSSL